MSTMSPMRALTPVEWRNEEILGDLYTVPNKIPAKAQMEQDVELRKLFRDEFPDRDSSEYPKWLDFELSEDVKTRTNLASFIKIPEGSHGSIDKLMANLSMDELEVMVLGFFIKTSPDKSELSEQSQKHSSRSNRKKKKVA